MTHTLVDTNVALRWAQASHPDYPITSAAVRALIEGGHTLYVAPQNLIEMWNSLTRPLENNGFALSPAQARIAVERAQFFFRLAPDVPEIFEEWKRIVAEREVRGAKAHDARLAAVMKVHGITHILTFNGRDFLRHPGVTVLDPNVVGASSTL